MFVESVVSNIVDSILLKRVENSGALSENISNNCQRIFSCFDAEGLTPYWQMLPGFNIRYQHNKDDLKIGRILGVSWPKIPI